MKKKESTFNKIIIGALIIIFGTVASALIIKKIFNEEPNQISPAQQVQTQSSPQQTQAQSTTPKVGQKKPGAK